MKTIKQISEEIGVSKQAIHQKIKQEPLSSSLQQYISNKGNTLYIDVDGENMIKSAFAKEVSSMVDVNQTSIIVNQLTTQYIESLQVQIGL